MFEYASDSFKGFSSTLVSTSLRWYVNRIRRMGVGEVFFRLVDVVNKFHLRLAPGG